MKLQASEMLRVSSCGWGYEGVWWEAGARDGSQHINRFWRQGQMASYSQAGFSGQHCGVGGEQNSPAVSLKTMRRNRPWGGCLLSLLLAADPMPRFPGQEMSETPWRIVQGLERKPLTLATIRRSEGGGRGKSLFA